MYLSRVAETLSAATIMIGPALRDILFDQAEETMG
jgi:hypothetical protein